jgi:hypothetical protein
MRRESPPPSLRHPPDNPASRDRPAVSIGVAVTWQLRCGSVVGTWRFWRGQNDPHTKELLTQFNPGGRSRRRVHQGGPSSRVGLGWVFWAFLGQECPTGRYGPKRAKRGRSAPWGKQARCAMCAYIAGLTRPRLDGLAWPAALGAGGFSLRAENTKRTETQPNRPGTRGASIDVSESERSGADAICIAGATRLAR